MTSATSHALAMALGAALGGGSVWLWRDKVAAQRAAFVAHVPRRAGEGRGVSVTVLRADARGPLGRHGISVDLSADYCRIAADPTVLDNRVRKVLDIPKAAAEVDGQADLFGEATA